MIRFRVFLDINILGLSSSKFGTCPRALGSTLTLVRRFLGVGGEPPFGIRASPEAMGT